MRPWVEAPPIDILLDGSRLDAAALDRVTSVVVRQMVLAPAQCEIVVRDPPAALVAHAAGAPDTRLRVVVRDGTDLFSGELSAVELVHAPTQQRELRIRGYDPLQRLRRRRPVRILADTTLASLAAQLAADCGLQSESAAEGGRWELLPQWRSSDLDLMIDAATRSGVWFAVSDGTLRLFPITGRGVSRDLRLGDTLLQARVERATSEAPARFRAVTWDAATGRVSDESQGLPPLAGGTSAGDRTLVNLLPAEQPAYRLGAAVAYESAAAATLWGVAEGDPALQPGVTARLAGAGTPFDGDYVLTEVTHTIDATRGYLTELSSRPPAPREPQPAAVVAPGLVTRVDDPLGLGRVQASLPTYPSISSGWMRVVLPAAGRDKGLTALPDVGDEVLVLLPGGEPAHGIVLGGLYGAHAPPDAGVSHGAVARHGWRTRGGQTVTLDDERGRLALTNRAGTVVALDDERTAITSATDLEISAPGRRITIRAAAVDFQKG